MNFMLYTLALHFIRVVFMQTVNSLSSRRLMSYCVSSRATLLSIFGTTLLPNILRTSDRRCTTNCVSNNDAVRDSLYCEAEHQCRWMGCSEGKPATPTTLYINSRSDPLNIPKDVQFEAHARIPARSRSTFHANLHRETRRVLPEHWSACRKLVGTPCTK